ncbi:unnamed protein product [Ilex paraguariensis]|uniref:Pentatricopeptide repeat-containing protein n=1 Tax=Ilex paraguariensis TaxID=185542 RepID=A0ABC8RAV5_9AQUA
MDPGRETNGCIVDLGRAGEPGEAAKLIHEMEYEPDAMAWRTLLGVCRAHRNMNLSVYVAKQILKLDPSDAGTHILLLYMYVNSQRWEVVAEVSTMMSRRVKELGVAGLT